jgi:hypothetical protein
VSLGAAHRSAPRSSASTTNWRLPDLWVRRICDYDHAGAAASSALFIVRFLLRLLGYMGLLGCNFLLVARRPSQMVAYLIGGGLIQCSCAAASVHAEPSGCKTSQVSASLPASIR